MELSNLITIVIWCVCAVICQKLARKKGYNPHLAAFFGVIGGVISVIVYACLSNKNIEDKKELKVGHLMLILLGLTVFLFIVSIIVSIYEESSYTENYEYTEDTSYQKVEDTSYQNVEDTSIAPWMVGKWKGSSYVMDWNNNTVKLFVNLEIDKYGNATEFMQMQGGSLEVEQFTLKYDRSSEQLYFNDGGMRVTIQVDSYNKKLFMQSSSGTTYLHKEY